MSPLFRVPAIRKLASSLRYAGSEYAILYICIIASRRSELEIFFDYALFILWDQTTNIFHTCISTAYLGRHWPTHKVNSKPRKTYLVVVCPSSSFLFIITKALHCPPKIVLFFFPVFSHRTSPPSPPQDPIISAISINQNPLPSDLPCDLLYILLLYIPNIFSRNLSFTSYRAKA